MARGPEAVYEIWVPDRLLGAVQTWEWEVMPFLILLLASSFLIGGVRFAFDIANDVINYLKFRCTTARPSVAGETELAERQQPIRNTFNEAIRFLADQYKFDELVVISHSQGTVIALDELAESSFGRSQEWLEEIDLKLVTMGSPMADLYQHYFPIAYPPWSDKKRWGRLEARVDRWLSLYRSGDFIGTTLDMPETEGRRLGFSEVCLGSGGHQDYWRDPRVAAELHDGRIIG